MIALVACGALLVVHIAHYFPVMFDDAFISLRYVQRFLEGKGLTWTDGPRVEGYSNLLWILLTAALGATGLDLILIVRALGLIASLGVLAAVGYAAIRFTMRPFWTALAGGLVWAASAPAAAWAMGGLEMPLVACLLAWALVWSFDVLHAPEPAALRLTLRIGCCLGAMALTRPDAILFAPVIAIGLSARARGARRSLLAMAQILAIPALLVAAQFVFRRSYYGEWWPNTAYVKINPSIPSLQRGLEYVGNGLSSLRPLAELGGAAVVALCLGRARREHGVLLALVGMTWLAYVAAIGGDVFAAWRMTVPVIVVLSLACVLATGWAFDAWWPSHRRRFIACGVSILAIAIPWSLIGQFRNHSNQIAARELWEWNGQVVGTTLKRGFHAQQPLLALTAAGAMPYWSELPCLDLLGLLDHHIARVPAIHLGRGRQGHEKGDVSYVLARKPDLIHFGTPGGSIEPLYAYAKELPARPEFRLGYELCLFGSPVPNGWFVSRIWASRDSPKIGIQRRDNGRVLVPSYLLNSTGRAVARLDASDQFVVDVTEDSPVGIRRLDLEAGHWEVVEPKAIRLLVIDSRLQTILPVTTSEPPSFDVTRSGPYDLTLVPSASPISLRALVLQNRSRPRRPYRGRSRAKRRRMSPCGSAREIREGQIAHYVAADITPE